ncbi:MAG: hypothetical protein Q9195_006910 [Heterodermia aff. obscurata]
MAQDPPDRPPGAASKPLDQCRLLSRKDWELQRERVCHLYCQKDQPLKRVIDEMKSQYGFAATERQYKRKITEWRIDKNVKDDEMRAILAKQDARKREGKDSVFYVRGRLVQNKKIDRFRHRKGLSGGGLDTIEKPQSKATGQSARPVYGSCTAKALIPDDMEDIVCHSPSYDHFPHPNSQSPPIECNSRQSKAQLSDLPAQREAFGQELGSKVFNLLEPAMQSYSDPSIIEWYKSRNVSPESHQYAMSETTSGTDPASTRIQTSGDMYSRSIDTVNGLSVDPDAGRSEGLITQDSSIASQEMDSASTKRLSIQSLLSPKDERPLKDFSAARLGRSNIEDLILDGLTWLSSCAP